MVARMADPGLVSSGFPNLARCSPDSPYWMLGVASQ
jgi:hypothetical protein